MITKKCLCCDKILQTRHQLKFCSNRCQTEFKYKSYILSWKKKPDAISASKNISKHIKKFLIEKTGEKCSKCNWCQRNPTSQNIPLEVDHIDGNAQNNLESNLRLLCPNCHALTPYFRNLNKGRGRKWRIKKKLLAGNIIS